MSFVKKKNNKIFILLFLFTFSGLLFTLSVSKQKQNTAQYAAGTGQFHVLGNKIIDPNGNPFIVKGIDAIYGRFAGGDQNGYGLTNYNNAGRDLDYLKTQGINLIRLSVSADAATPGNAWNIPNYMTELDNAITLITQRGLVVELSQGETQDPAVAAAFLGQLSAKYKNNPLVWIKADNEPFCIINQSHCNDWPYWQEKHQLYIQAIRNAGYTGPIVINCLSWSWDCSKIAQYPLNDSNLIYGSHMYSNGATDFQTSSNTGPNAANTGWANLANQYAMIVDEVGSFNQSLTPTSQLHWNEGFLDFTVDWIKNRGGNGVIAFNFYWSDQNNMSNGSGHWNDWGTVFYTHYLTKISSSLPPTTNVSPTASPKPTETAAVSPTSSPTDIVISLTVCPHGLGICGDNEKLNSGGNQNPLHTELPVTIFVYTANNTLIVTKHGTVIYNPSTHTFQGNINLGNITTASYLIRVQINEYLTKQIPGIQALHSAQTTQLPTIALVTGDINNDNQIDILDYNMLINCFGSKFATPTCLSRESDLTDDGIVDGSDYNLFLRELSVQKGA